ncbi:uncharacterized protein LOC135489122 [Lineus longissimus]|uniref:uncharacterized protein LOC135489122 n=1 Tax=Lineus longissimus TaxID=88925 RepID=UPI002B4C41FF
MSPKFLSFSLCLVLLLTPTSGNIALNKPTEQSSTNSRGESWKAVDGNRSPLLYQHASCAVTVPDEPGKHWWYVDLLRDYPIREVEIVARGEGNGNLFADWDLIVATAQPPTGFFAAAGGQICYSQSGSSTDGQVYTLSCNETVGRYVGIQRRTNGGVLELCEVEVDVREQAANLALKKRTLQFDTFYNAAASRAVDGNRDMFYSSNSCTHTNADRSDSSNNNWWAVDLGEETVIMRVVLYNRADCCGNRLANFDIVVTNQEPTPGQKFVYALDEVCAHQGLPVPQGGIARYACTNLTGQYVAVVQPRKLFLTLCEVEVFDHMIPQTVPHANNLALKKPTQQFDDANVNHGKSSNAVDGNRGQVYHASGCTHTSSDASDIRNNNWWSVDLERETAVSSVVLYNRGDCCGSRLQNFDIVVTDTVPVTGKKLAYSPSEVCLHKNGAIQQGAVVTFPCVKQGRYVAVVQSRRQPLTLCEVEVYGVPSVTLPTPQPQIGNYQPTALPLQGATVPPTMAPKQQEYFNAEHRLLADLLKNYDRGIRPVSNLSETVTVKIGLAAISVVKMNAREESIALNSWMRYAWVDKRFLWDPAKYDGVDHIRIRWDKIWRPDITLYNSAEPQSMNPVLEDTNAIVVSNGNVLYIPHMFFKASCTMDLTYFPWDKQICHFKFGSWSFDGFKLDLVFFDAKEKMDFSDYVADSQWTILDAPATKHVKRYPCCEEPYPDITYKIILKRNGVFLLDCGPGILLAFLIPLVFLMPHGTGDKTSLGFCIMLCLLIMIAFLEEFLYTTLMPILVYYYVISFIMVGISLFITTLINNIFIGCTMAPPSSIFQACSGIGKIMCVSTASAKTDTFALMDSEGNATPNPTSARARWIYIATVFDRIMFVVFTIIVVIITTTLFVRM